MRYACLWVCWVLDGDFVSQLPYVWYYVFVKSRFKHAREECERVQECLCVLCV